MSPRKSPRQLRQMLDAIAAEYRYASRFTGLPAPDARVMTALAEVPREDFVAADQRPFAYNNLPLPIEAGQTISQPFIVALMTDLLAPAAEDSVLEVGTGSGYQAAILSRLVRRVYTMEIIDALADEARQRLATLGYDNVRVRTGNGRLGWPEHAPYDGIIVTAAAPEIPPALLVQLKPGARLVIPVRQGTMGQALLLLEKDAGEKIHTREILPVAFVPLTGGQDNGEEA
ncbi:MAG: protein-L-isoaspartate(D-aspartate) O-methyltransferase [Desulfuromonadales bacterium]